MSALKDALKIAAAEIQLSGPLGTFLRKLVDNIDAALIAITAIFSARFAEKDVSGGPIAIGVGGTALINTIQFTSEAPNEKVYVSWTGSRSNTSGTQVVLYEFRLDQARIGSYIVANAGSEMGAMSDLLTAADPGLHTIEVWATENPLGAGVETIEAGATLVAIGQGAI